MANLDYCKFENTLADLRDCYSDMSEPQKGSPEYFARRRLIKLCMDIAEEYGPEVNE